MNGKERAEVDAEMLFDIGEIITGGGRLQYRRERLTGLSCRISTARLARGLDQMPQPLPPPVSCPFCPDRIQEATPSFSDGSRIVRGESVTFPNLFPYGAWHTVTVITRAHAVERFTKAQLLDAFLAQIDSIEGRDGFPSINWNFLPSAGASIAHPHLQGLVDVKPSFRVRRYVEEGERYLRERGRTYWEELKRRESCSPRHLFGDGVMWIANPVPLGEREVLGLLPVTHLEGMRGALPEFINGLMRIMEFYRSLGTAAFNLSIFFEEEGKERGFNAFCSMIARINPNPSSLSDSSFMERLHLEPLILTMPEELGALFRGMKGSVPA